jgi:hypothetical protein
LAKCSASFFLWRSSSAKDTNESAEELGLANGKSAVAIIKASNVVVEWSERVAVIARPGSGLRPARAQAPAGNPVTTMPR